MKSTISTSTASQTFGKTPRRIRGQGMTEYIIVVALVGLAAVVAVGYFGDAIQAQFAGMGYALSGEAGEIADAVKVGADAAGKAEQAATTDETLKTYGQ